MSFEFWLFLFLLPMCFAQKANQKTTRASNATQSSDLGARSLSGRDRHRRIDIRPPTEDDNKLNLLEDLPHAPNQLEAPNSFDATPEEDLSGHEHEEIPAADSSHAAEPSRRSLATSGDNDQEEEGDKADKVSKYHSPQKILKYESKNSRELIDLSTATNKTSENESRFNSPSMDSVQNLSSHGKALRKGDEKVANKNTLNKGEEKSNIKEVMEHFSSLLSNQTISDVSFGHEQNTSRIQEKDNVLKLPVIKEKYDHSAGFESVDDYDTKPNKKIPRSESLPVTIKSDGKSQKSDEQGEEKTSGEAISVPKGRYFDKNETKSTKLGPGSLSELQIKEEVNGLLNVLLKHFKFIRETYGIAFYHGDTTSVLQEKFWDLFKKIQSTQRCKDECEVIMKLIENHKKAIFAGRPPERFPTVTRKPPCKSRPNQGKGVSSKNKLKNSTVEREYKSLKEEVKVTKLLAALKKHYFYIKATYGITLSETDSTFMSRRKLEQLVAKIQSRPLCDEKCNRIFNTLKRQGRFLFKNSNTNSSSTGYRPGRRTKKKTKGVKSRHCGNNTNTKKLLSALRQYFYFIRTRYNIRFLKKDSLCTSHKKLVYLHSKLLGESNRCTDTCVKVLEILSSVKGFSKKRPNTKNNKLNEKANNLKPTKHINKHLNNGGLEQFIDAIGGEKRVTLCNMINHRIQLLEKIRDDKC